MCDYKNFNKKDLIIERDISQGSEFNPHVQLHSSVIRHLPYEGVKEIGTKIPTFEKDISLGAEFNPHAKLSCSTPHHLPGRLEKEDTGAKKITEIGNLERDITKGAEWDENVIISSSTPHHLPPDKEKNKNKHEPSYTDEMIQTDPIKIKRIGRNYHSDNDNSNRLNGESQKISKKQSQKVFKKSNKNTQQINQDTSHLITQFGKQPNDHIRGKRHFNIPKEGVDHITELFKNKK